MGLSASLYVPAPPVHALNSILVAHDSIPTCLWQAGAALPPRRLVPDAALPPTSCRRASMQASARKVKMRTHLTSKSMTYVIARLLDLGRHIHAPRNTLTLIKNVLKTCLKYFSIQIILFMYLLDNLASAISATEAVSNISRRKDGSLHHLSGIQF